jgi:hypothetical protein
MTISTICIHAFIAHPDGSVEYCDDSATPTGWTVYARSELEHGEFDLGMESDYPDFGEAMEHAIALSSAYDVPLHHY